MQAPEYDIMRSVEDRHWWYSVLRDLVERALAGRLASHSRLLDAGCGTGGMLDYLQRRSGDLEVTGIDVAEQAVRCCNQRGLTTVRVAAVEALPFDDASFDAILSLDVLYHSSVNEERALAEMRRVLRPDGLLLMNLPAFAGLRGSHDVAVHGARRYAACQARSLLEQSNFAVEQVHYWNAWLFLPLLLWRQVSRLSATPARESVSDLKLTPAWMNSLLAGMGRLDAGFCQEFHIPFGSSVFAVARKTQSMKGGGAHGCN
ncbi:class I SAM-dependent methyltransferase [Prosthecobacter sp.]|uniref:class I SAM-dependent methyltransferase n=1 Tax=Prosthecobacter sp. TaxID=1965333 RepID=UPI003784435F